MIYKVLNDIGRFDEASFQHLMEAMPAERRNAYSSIGNPITRRRSMSAYALLIELLRESGNLEAYPSFLIGEHGKPRLAEHPDIEFNISHCSNAVAVALHNAPIGIDVECRRKITPALVSKVCHAEELAWLQKQPDEQLAFIRLWTRKEAYVKMTGTGIRLPLEQLALPLADGIGEQNGTPFSLTSQLLPDGNGWLSICYAL